MSRTIVAVLVVAGALGLSGFSCGGTQEPPPNPFTCSAQIRGAVNEDLWCFAGTFDYTQFPDGGFPEWALNIPLYRGTLVAPEVAGGVGVFFGGPPLLGVAYGWQAGVGSNVSAGGAEFSQAGFGMQFTHQATAPLSQYDSGTGSASVTFTRLPLGPTDYLGAHGVVNASLPSLGVVGAAPGPVTLRVVF